MSKDFLSPEEQQQRKSICDACPSKKDMTGNPLFTLATAVGFSVEHLAKNVCGECLCFIDFKVKKEKHTCPLGKWER